MGASTLARADGGVVDAALAREAGISDAGIPDSGAAPAIVDAGLVDAGPVDAGLADAGLADGGHVASSSGDHAGGFSPFSLLDDESTALVVRSVLALGVLVLLIWLASHPWVRRIEEALGVREIVTSGLVFVALGVVLSLPSVAILTPELLEGLAPLLHFALGWLGFIVGFQLDVRMLDRLPRGTSTTVAIESAAPFVIVTLAFGVALYLFGEPLDEDGLFARHALTLGAAGSVSLLARARPPLFRADEPQDVLRYRIDVLDEVVAVAVLALLGAFFRPRWVEWRWDLPGTVWLFLTVGLGVAVGLLVYVMVRERASAGEFVAIVIGSVAFGAGVAGYLYLSPIVICFAAGALLTNLPFEARERVWTVLTTLERPITLALLVVAGALWDISDWRGFVLVPLFVVTRALGGLISKRLIDRTEHAPEPGKEPPILRPSSPIALAIVIGAQAMYRGQAISWIVTAVIGGAIVTEAIVQIGARLSGRRQPGTEPRKRKGKGRGARPAPASGDGH
ncbi:MAG: hypothetical protein AB7S26_36950 [Sandaracinaceae bacterium]